MMHRSLYSLVIVALLFGTACSFTAKSPEYTEPEPATDDDGAIAVTIKWGAAGGGDGNQDMTLADGVIYWADCSAGAVGATDIATGKLLWYNKTVGRTISNPLVGAKGIYILRDGSGTDHPTLCVLIDRRSGATITTIQLPSEGYDLRMFSWIRTDTSLVWHAQDIGLVSLDEALIDTSLAVQTLTPETLWPGLYEWISVPL